METDKETKKEGWREGDGEIEMERRENTSHHLLTVGANLDTPDPLRVASVCLDTVAKGAGKQT